MDIMLKGTTPEGTHVQIEDWSQDYSFRPYASVIGAYPVSKHTMEGQFSPKRNRKFRFELVFSTHAEAQEAFNSLEQGTKTLRDFDEYYNGKRENLECV